MIFGDTTVGGKQNDLRNLSFTLKEWNDVELIVKDKQVTVKVNGSVVFETSYTRPAKNIAGLAFISNGLCEVEYADLRGLDQKEVVKFGVIPN